MQTVLIYPMMIDILLKACIKEIKRMHKSFIWGDTMEKSKYHVVSWHMLTNLKDGVGLGFMKLKQMNKVYFMKLAW